MKIVFVFDGLQFGGIERVGIEYIKLLKNRGHDIRVINLVKKLNDMESELPKDMEVIQINFPRNICPERYSKLQRMGIVGRLAFYAITSFTSIIQFVYRYIYEKKLPTSDVVIAFSGHYNDLTFISNNFKKTKKKIAWLHGNQFSYDEIAPGYFRLYKKIKNLVCLSNEQDENVNEFNKNNGITKVKIYNPINCADKEIDKKIVADLKLQYGDFCLMVARMAPDKDHKTVIKAFSLLKEKYGLNKKIVFVGDGIDRKSNERYSTNLNMTDNVIFVGARYDVQNYYSAASIFVHSSPAEGLPTTLLEAMYYGVPIASTDSKPGVYEILQDEYGLITPVGDADALAKSIFDLYTDCELSQRIVAQSNKRIKDFLPEYVIGQFEEFMER